MTTCLKSYVNLRKATWCANKGERDVRAGNPGQGLTFVLKGRKTHGERKERENEIN